MDHELEEAVVVVSESTAEPSRAVGEGGLESEGLCLDVLHENRSGVVVNCLGGLNWLWT